MQNIDIFYPNTFACVTILPQKVSKIRIGEIYAYKDW